MEAGNGVTKAGPHGRPLTADEELLCACGHPELADEDPERVARMAAELTAGFDALRGVVKAVSIFGSARAIPDSPEYAAARAVAQALGRAGFAVITGGGPGVMEAANRGARDAGALSIGLSIELPHEQRANDYVDRTVHFRYFFARKVIFVRYATAFVALPGGFGTLDELFEALTLIQTGKVSNFPVVLVGTDHWSGLRDWLRARLLDHGRIAHVDLDLLHVTDDADAVVDIVTRGHEAQLAALRARPAQRLSPRRPLPRPPSHDEE